MSLITNVHAENRSERRLSVFIFNLIVFIMSFFILVVYATQPFFKVEAKANLSKENLASIIQIENEEIDIKEVLPESIELKLILSLEADVVLDTAAKVLNQFIFNFNMDVDLTQEVTALIDDNVGLLIDQIIPELKSIVLETAKQVAIEKGKETILNALKESNPSVDYEQKLEDAGITDEYIGEKMEDVIEAVTAENATLDTVAETVVNVVNDIITDMTANNPDLELPEGFDEAALTETIKGQLESFADEDGNIDIEAALAELFNNAITVVSPEGSESANATTSKGMSMITAKAEEANETETPETEEMLDLTTTIRNAIMDLLGETIYDTAAQFLKIASLVLILSMFSWIYIMIKIIVKLFAKNNTVRFRVPILFGAIPGLLWLIPSIVMHFLSKNPELLDDPFPITLKFFASGWVAFLGVLVLIIISGPYAALRKGLEPKKLKKFK